MKTLSCFLLLVLFPLTARAVDWFEDDWEARVNSLSDGELVWYGDTAGEGSFLTRLFIRFLQTSHVDGWVEVKQCHSGLSGVPAAQLVFEGRPVRHLQVVSATNIERAVIDGDTVQLSGIAPPAELCVQSEQQVLHRLDQHHWALISGPFQRRFLDGYYPMRLEVTVIWPAEEWRYTRLRPAEGPVVLAEDGQLHLKAHFAGRLKTAMVFQHALP